MLLFGHIGITLGTVALVDFLFFKLHPSNDIQGESIPETSTVAQSRPSWFSSFLKRIDIRLLVIGSLLPDIIDKPAGFAFGISGRAFCHTLLFLILLSFVAFVFRRGRTRWLFPLVYGTFMHLVLDSMWRTPSVLFWPLFGWQFPPGTQCDLWLLNMLSALFSNPGAYVSELLGVAILLGFIVLLARKKVILSIVKHGWICEGSQG